MCSLPVDWVLLLSTEAHMKGEYRMFMCAGTLTQDVFSYDRICSLTIEWVRLRWNVFSYDRVGFLTIKWVLLLCAGALTQDVFSYDRMCFLTIELRQNVFSY